MVRNLMILTLLGMFIWGNANAQDPQFSQFYNAPLYLNPAYTGTGPKAHHRFVANYRNQWPAISTAFRTAAFSYDYYHRKLNSGFGLMVTQDVAGTANLKATNVGLLYSYKIHLANKWVITPGIHFSYSMRSIDYNKLVFGDQFELGRDELYPTTDLIDTYGKGYIDFGSGLLIYNKSVWVGLSAYHMNKPNHSLIDGSDQLPVKYSIHAGYRVPLYYGPKGMKKMSSLAPSFIYKKQGQFDQLDLGLHFQYDPIMAGFWYRGIPVTQDIPDRVNQDALTFLFGLRFDEIQVGYSYDITISAMGPSSGGSHEVSLIYQFERRSNAKTSVRREKFIPCPTF